MRSIIVELTFFRIGKIPTPRKRLHDNTVGQHVLKMLLRFFELVQRNRHIKVMRRMLHNMVHRCAKFALEREMNGCRDKRLRRCPLLFVVIPCDVFMRVVDVNHPANHAVPKDKRNHKSSD